MSVARSNNYAEAYRRRIERGLARGLTRQEARGHGSPKRSGTAGPAPLPYSAKLEEALRRLRRSGASLSQVAREAHVSRERLSHYAKTVAGARRDGKIWRFDDRRIRKMAIIDANEDAPVVVRVGFEDAHRAGQHWQEAGLALHHRERRADFVRRWEGQRIRDVNGRWHTLYTNFSQIFRAILTQDYSFERFYAIEH